MVKVNLKGQELMTFDPVPPGTYRDAVDQCDDTRVSQESGQPNIFWLFKITDVVTVRGEAMDGLVGRTIMHGTSLIDAALWNVYRTLIALGVDPEQLEDGEYEIIPEDFIGRECIITVNQREYQGTMRNNVVAMRTLNEQEAGKLV